MQHLRLDGSGYQCPGQKTVASCNAANEIAVVTACTGVSTLNSMMCSNIGSTSHVATVSQKSTKCASCCAADGCSAAGSTPVAAAVAAVLLFAVAVVA
jgi:hypothetical protein